MPYPQHLRSIHAELRREYPEFENEIGDLCFRIECLINSKTAKWDKKKNTKRKVK